MGLYFANGGTDPLKVTLKEWNGVCRNGLNAILGFYHQPGCQGEHHLQDPESKFALQAL